MKLSHFMLRHNIIFIFVLWAIFDGRFRGLEKCTGPSCVHMYPKLQHFNSGRMKLQVKCSGRRVPITHASRTQSTSSICRAAPVSRSFHMPLTCILFIVIHPFFFLYYLCWFKFTFTPSVWLSVIFGDSNFLREHNEYLKNDLAFQLCWIDLIGVGSCTSIKT